MDQSIFREYDIRGIVGEQLNKKTVTEISHAVAAYFVRYKAKKIVVGYDARESSPEFQQILISAFRNAKLDVLDIGRVPTPVLYFALYTQKVDGGVMITASHNPANHNGFKISLGTNSLFGTQIQEIKEIASNNIFQASAPEIENLLPTVEKKNLLKEYEKQLLQRISLVKRNLKVVVDAGNGMGGVTAIPFYRKLGVEVVDLYGEPDSHFPNHEADPSQEKNLQDLIEKVLTERADLGIAFDGDGDRLTIIDNRGKIIWGDELMILLSREVLREHPDSTIIAEVKCTQTLFDEIEKFGGKSIMSKAGHSIIKAKMRETKAILGGEMSGHIFFADRFYGFDDACYAGARVLEILSKTGKKLSEIFSEFPQKFATPEIRFKCAEEKKHFVVKKIIEKFSKTNEVITIDGARIKFENGWGLVRPSNTQALMILRFEANSPAHLNEIQRRVEDCLKNLLPENKQID